jgi:hypothetical protein
VSKGRSSRVSAVAVQHIANNAYTKALMQLFSKPERSEAHTAATRLTQIYTKREAFATQKTVAII